MVTNPSYAVPQEHRAQLESGLKDAKPITKKWANSTADIPLHLSKIAGATMAKQGKGDVPTHEEDEILTPNEAGRLINKAGNTIRQWIKDGLLEAFKYPGRVGQFGVRRSHVMKLIDNSALGGR